MTLDELDKVPPPYDPNADTIDRREKDDTRKEALTLKKLNRLKKMRALKKLDAMKRQDILGVMYAQAADGGGGGPMF